MSTLSVPHIEENIARCRLILSAVALVALFVDPTESIMSPGPNPHESWFSIDPYTLAILGSHLGYSGIVYSLLTRRLAATRVSAPVTTWIDVFFGAVIAFFTEGASSPFYAFFLFAVIEAGFRSGFRRTLIITAVAVALYLGLIVASAPGSINFYIMRPVYLGIVGYLVAYLAQQRLNLEADLRAFAAADQRNLIARDLHDGWAQALAGINLKIETCRELLRRRRVDESAAELAELQDSVTTEYDELRDYMRSLAGVAPQGSPTAMASDATFSISVEVVGSGPLVEHVLQIIREGVSNVLRHAKARSAQIRVAMEDEEIAIRIEDDGVGFRSAEQRPWSIASRVRELGGDLQVVAPPRGGAHLAITLPRS